MNRKHTENVAVPEQQNGQYAVTRNRKADIVALVICLLLAVLVWLMFMNGTESDYVELVIEDECSSCEYTLSVTQVEIEGSAADLREIEAIGVDLSRVDKKHVTVVTENKVIYEVTEANLLLPEGVALSKPLNLTVTVINHGK